MSAETSANPRPVPLSEEVFKREKSRLIISTLATSTLVVFAVETILMVLLEPIFDRMEPISLFLDGLILVLILLPLNYIFIVRPMTEHFSAQQHYGVQLVKSHSTLEGLFSITDVCLVVLDARFNMMRVNQAFAALAGCQPAELAGKNFFDFYPDGEARTYFKTVVETGKSFSVLEKPLQIIGRPQSGAQCWDWNLLPVKNEPGQVTELLLALSDATERKSAREAAAESERRFRGIFDQTVQHIALLEPSGKVQLVNQAAREFTGYNLDAEGGSLIWDLPWWLADPAQTGLIQSAVQQAAGGAVCRNIFKVASSSGVTAYLDTTIKPLLVKDGQPAQLIYEASDITNRMQAEEALRSNEDEIKRLFEAEKRAHQFAETLREAGKELSSSLNSGTVLEIYLDQLAKVIPYHMAYLLLLDDEDHLVVRLARSSSAGEAEEMVGRRFEIAALPFLHPLLTDRRPLIFGGVPVDLCGQDPLTQGDIRSFLGIPLHAGENVVGVALVERPHGTFFTPDLMHWAGALTGQAVIAMQNAWLFEQVRDNRERLQALSRRMVEVQELERQHIARELHDEAGQSLASLMVGLRLLERDGVDQPTLSLRCQELRSLTDGVLENLHRLAVDLRPSSLDHLGLVAALRQHTENISDQHELTVQFETVGEIGRLPDEMETAVYRIVQEAMTNIVRHADATRADVILERREDSLLVIVEDNGKGFDVHAPYENHFGLVGMRERAEMLGGTFSVESEAGRGTTVIVEVACPSSY